MRIRPAKRGLSLIEILIGISLLGGAVLVVLGLFPTAYSSLIQARDTTAAQNLGREILERARGTPYSSLAGVSNVPVNITSQVNGGNVVTQYFYDLTFNDSSPTSGIYSETTVLVRWTSGSVPGSGTSHLIRLDTVIRNP